MASEGHHLRWLIPLYATSSAEILNDSGVDAVLFLRYLKVMITIFGTASLTIAPVLLSLNVTGGKDTAGGINGMDQLAWSNIKPSKFDRYWGHLVCAIAFVAYILIVITKELKYAVALRQHILTPHLRPQSHFILLSHVPVEFAQVPRLKKFYGTTIGYLEQVYCVRDMRALNRMIDRRNLTHRLLEQAETWLIQSRILRVTQTTAIGDQLGSLDRQTIHVPFFPGLPALPFLGNRVDKVDYLRDRLASLNRDITLLQETPAKSPEWPAVLLEFSTATAAQNLAHSISWANPCSTVPTYLGTSTKDVLWDNLGISWKEAYIRTTLSSVLSVLTILVWTAPIALTGVLSQLDYLADMIPNGEVITRLPSSVIGLLQGLLPQVALVIIMQLFPILLRRLVLLQRPLTRIVVEEALQSLYFAFLFLHLFFTMSISSSLVTTLSEFLNRTDSITTVLANNIPKASNYFLSFVLLQAFSFAALVCLQLGGFYSICIGYMMDKTAREKFSRPRRLLTLQWGVLYPVYSNLACIVIVFAVIAPLILPLACVSFGVFFVFFRYVVIFTGATVVDTKGRLYPRALFQTFLGVYVAELSLTGLFALRYSFQHDVAAQLQAAAMGGLLILTGIYHAMLKAIYSPMLETISLSRSTAWSDAEDDEWLTKMIRNIVTSKDNAPGENDPTMEHPAVRMKRPVVWLAADPFGFCQREQEDIEEQHSSWIPTSHEGATVDTDGRLRIRKGTGPHLSILDDDL